MPLYSLIGITIATVVAAKLIISHRFDSHYAGIAQVILLVVIVGPLIAGGLAVSAYGISQSDDLMPVYITGAVVYALPFMYLTFLGD